MVARADHGDPPVRAQARGVVVAVGQPRLLRRRHHPRGGDIPKFHLLLHAAFDGIARHHAAQHALRVGQRRPAAFSQPVNVVEKLGAMRNERSPGAGSVVQRPFETGVTDVDGQESHAADYPEFCSRD
ncbi:hypothetical protein D3C87_1702700 [compost metagenome]